MCVKIFQSGACIIPSCVSNTIESTIIDNNSKYSLLELRRDVHGILYSKKSYVTYSDLKDWIFVPIPHFCKIENLYTILQKYCDSDDEIFLCGISYRDGMNKEILKTDLKIMYFKTENTYLEIILCGYNYIWINEYESIYKFDLPNIDNYYVYMGRYFKVFNDKAGVLFYDDIMDAKFLIGYSEYYKDEKNYFSSLINDYTNLNKDEFKKKMINTLF